VSDPVSETSAPDRERLTAALFEARRELIDLSRRNRSLHATRSGPRPHCLEIIDVDADEFFVALTRNGKQFGFGPAADAQAADAAPENTARAKPALLQTRLAPEPLARRLLKLFREARTYEEEQGANILFLAIGFLHWFEDARSEERSSAPLLLVPVSLERRQGRDPFILRGRDDDLMLNISLAEKLRIEFGIALPELPAGDDWRPCSYFDEVAGAVAGQRRWEVEPDGIGLGFFTFSKFLMWRDLDANSWPEATGLLGNRFVAKLLGEDRPGELSPPLAADDEPIDHHVDLAAAIHVVDADSSQALCVEEGRLGRDLVVQGPPGTGKSQTIANIIAAAAHDGKTVLFVAEKAAALEVVHNRLKSVGLEPLCLELHSNKAAKLSVVTSLARALDAPGAAPVDGQTVAELRAARDRLNRWSATLHREIRRSGRTPYQVIGIALKHRGDGVRVLDQPFQAAADCNRDRLREAKRAVERAAAAVTRLGTAPARHAWHGTLAEPLAPFDVDRLEAALGAASKRAGELVSADSEAATALRVEQNASCAVLRDRLRAFRLLARIPAGREILAHPAWRVQSERIARLLEEGRLWSSGRAALAERVVESAWDCELDKVRQIIAAYGRSAFRHWIARYRGAVNELRGCCRGKPPRRLEERLGLLDGLIAARAARREIENEDQFGRAVLGPIWAAENTRWPAVAALLAWIGEAAEAGEGPDLTALAASVDAPACGALADRLEAAIDAFGVAFAKVSEVVRPGSADLFGAAGAEHAPLEVICDRLDKWSAAVADINLWTDARITLDAVRSWGFGAIADGLNDGSIGAGEARAIAELQIAEALWRCACADDPELPRLDGGARDATIAEFRALDRRRIELARSEVLASYLGQRPTGVTGEMAIVRVEIGKKRRHLAVRRLMESAGSAVQRLKPVFLMSPLSVAQFLPPGRLSFDLAVIDEASQVPPEEALGAIARCRQLIVVGDDKQLPPTNFFRMVAADDGESSDDGAAIVHPDRTSDFESILTLAKVRGVAERMLRWHYRSRHPSLIAVSNQLCYGGELLLPPSPLTISGDLGLSLVKTPRGHYDRGGSGRNPAEAELIAGAVEEHLAKCPGRSLGIACFSIAQRDAVDDALQARGVLAAAEAFAPSGERLFVKNLEAVQGDERDVIFISIGYGPDAQGRLTANFGPVSQDGGERRLNVLITRARQQCVVFSSITAGDIAADSKPQGTRMLREFLHFAETGKTAAGEVGTADFDSPFEEAVASIVRRRGYEVVPQVGVSGFRIDLGILDPKQRGRFVLGIECDGAAYHSGRSARDRDRLRQQVLEGLGWKLYRIWSTDWFRAPLREADRLLAAIERACDAREAVDAAVKPELAGPTQAPMAAVVGDLAKSALSDPYCECALPAARGSDLLGLPRPQLAALAAEVVREEGPIHLEEVAKRIRQAFGLDRTGRRILEAIGAALELAEQQGSVARNGLFWSPRERTLTLPRCRRDAAASLRRPDRIARCEYQLAINTVLRACAGAARPALISDVAHVLGFERTGNGLDGAISRQLDAMIAKGEVESVADSLRLTPAAAS
jgi:very-short-patch-repair endonuclease